MGERMIYREEIRDLFSVDNDYYFMHCISADFAMGAGIAVEFNKRFNTRTELMNRFKGDSTALWDNNIHGYNILQGNVLNLVTKRNYWEKPTYESMRAALTHAKTCCEIHHIKRVALPMIGCGLDGLKWEKVSAILQDVFAGNDIELLVCKLE